MVKKISVPHMLELGLDYAGFPKERQRNEKKNLERFRGFYGASPETLCVIYHDIQKKAPKEHRIKKPNVKYFLMTFYWFFEHDQSLPRVTKARARDYPRWHKSPAYYQLKKDHKAGLHHIMTAKRLRETNPVYTPFPVDVLQSHIQQLSRAQTENGYWKMQRMLKEKQK